MAETLAAVRWSMAVPCAVTSCEHCLQMQTQMHMAYRAALL